MYKNILVKNNEILSKIFETNGEYLYLENFEEDADFDLKNYCDDMDFDNETYNLIKDNFELAEFDLDIIPDVLQINCSSNSDGDFSEYIFKIKDKYYILYANPLGGVRYINEIDKFNVFEDKWNKKITKVLNEIKKGKHKNANIEIDFDHNKFEIYWDTL